MPLRPVDVVAFKHVSPQVMATIRTANPVSRALFQRAYAYKKAAYESGDVTGGRSQPTARVRSSALSLSLSLQPI